MIAPDEFDLKVVEAVAQNIREQTAVDLTPEAKSSSLLDDWAREDALTILRTLHSLGVLAGPGEVVVPPEAAKAVRVLLNAFTALEAMPSEEYPTFKSYRGSRRWHALAMAFNQPALDLAAAPRTGTEEGA